MTQFSDQFPSPPPAQGSRMDWSQAPQDLRKNIQEKIGSLVVQASSQATGFSPGIASRVLLADGRKLFIKAISPAQNPDSPRMHRREGKIVNLLPKQAPVPRLIMTLDEDGLGEGWIVLIFEDIDGHCPKQPWQSQELERVLLAVEKLGQTLSSISLPEALHRSAESEFAHSICGWNKLLKGANHCVDALDPWSRDNLEILAKWEDQAPTAVKGRTLLHFDLRADNMLLTPDKVWFVDWPHACIGAAWVDWVLLAPSVTMQGGPSPEALMAKFVQPIEPERLLAAVAAQAGYFTYQSLQKPPPGLPTLRAFQAAQGKVSRDWLARLLRF